jgi:hypothetical protein
VIPGFVARSRRVPLIAACVLLVAATGCQLRVEVAVDANTDGSGHVEVALGLDADALRRLKDLDSDGVSGPKDLKALVRVSDLEAKDWVISGPELGDDGFTRMRARKAFGTPAEASTIFAELTGAKGPFRFALTRDSSFTSTHLGFHGTVDFTGGLEAFGDAGLAKQLDGEPLGEDAKQIEKRLGAPLSRVINVRVAVRLPGTVESNAPTKADNGAVWQPRFGEGPVELRATSDVRHSAALGLIVAAGVAAFALVLLVLVRIATRVRARRAGTTGA